jgi:hypothetical protein
MPYTTSFGISGRFQPLFPGQRQISYVLLTLAPLYRVAPIPYDLHASSTPSAFDLNQDQILRKILLLTSKVFFNLTQACSFLNTLLFFYCQNIITEFLSFPRDSNLDRFLSSLATLFLLQLS